jgi:hypothetical protein
LGLSLFLGVFFIGMAQAASAAEVVKKLPFTKKVNLAVPAKYTFRFSLLDNPAAIVPAYAETRTINLTTKALTFLLGGGTPEPTSPAFNSVDFSIQYWLKIERKTNIGWAQVTAPSILNVAPYALWSATSSMAACSEVVSAPQNLNGYFTTIAAYCPAGQFAVSGGWSYSVWTATNTCIPYNNARVGTNGWSVSWAANISGACSTHSVSGVTPLSWTGKGSDPQR